jgi:hypothetical protein
VTGTFNTPLGKIRVASMRRFILLRRYTDKPVIVKRSDSMETLLRLRRTGDFILDTACLCDRRPGDFIVNPRCAKHGAHEYHGAPT